MKVQLFLTASAASADDPAAATPAGADAARASAPEVLFQETVESTDPTNSTGEKSVGCGGCFYCAQEMPACCEGVIGGADPRAPLPRRRRRPSPLHRASSEAAPRFLTVRWARRVLAVRGD